MRRTLLPGLMLVLGTAQAAEWVKVGASDDGRITTAMDVSGVRVVGQIRRTWVKREFAAHTQRGVGANADKWAKAVVGTNAYNCNDNSYRTESLIWYFEDGTDYATPTALFPGPWLPIGPDSVVQAEHKFICSRKR